MARRVCGRWVRSVAAERVERILHDLCRRFFCIHSTGPERTWRFFESSSIVYLSASRRDARAEKSSGKSRKSCDFGLRARWALFPESPFARRSYSKRSSIAHGRLTCRHCRAGSERKLETTSDKSEKAQLSETCEMSFATREPLQSCWRQLS